MEAFLFDGQSSQAQAVEIEFVPSGTLSLYHAGGTSHYPLSELQISSRLGNTPRNITLPDGAHLEVADNAGLEQALREAGDARGRSWLHHLESRSLYVLLALLLTIAFMWGGYRYLLPAFAETVAFSLPSSLQQQLGGDLLELMDAQLFSPSSLAPERQEQLQQRFEALAKRVPDTGAVQLLFRDGGEQIGANAFALPSGTIVMTDQLVALADNDDELLGVLAHELGHVVRRHALRQTLQSSVLGLFFVYLTGDAGSVLMTLPVLLLELGYSREFEREADDFAISTLREQGIALSHFGAILSRIDNSAHSEEPPATGSEIHNYLSTHPSTGERVQRLVTP